MGHGIFKKNEISRYFVMTYFVLSTLLWGPKVGIFLIYKADNVFLSFDFYLFELFCLSIRVVLSIIIVEMSSEII